MQEKPADPFFGPETARGEIAERIHVLRKRATHERTEADELEVSAGRLRENAATRDHIANQYERLLAP